LNSGAQKLWVDRGESRFNVAINSREIAWDKLPNGEALGEITITDKSGYFILLKIPITIIRAQTCHNKVMEKITTLSAEEGTRFHFYASPLTKRVSLSSEILEGEGNILQIDLVDQNGIVRNSFFQTQLQADIFFPTSPTGGFFQIAISRYKGTTQTLINKLSIRPINVELQSNYLTAEKNSKLKLNNAGPLIDARLLIKNSPRSISKKIIKRSTDLLTRLPLAKDLGVYSVKIYPQNIPELSASYLACAITLLDEQQHKIETNWLLQFSITKNTPTNAAFIEFSCQNFDANLVLGEENISDLTMEILFSDKSAANTNRAIRIMPGINNIELDLSTIDDGPWTKAEVYLLPLFEITSKVSLKELEIIR